MANDPRKAKAWMNPSGGAAKNPAPSQKRGWHPTATTAKPAEGRRRSLLLPALAGAVLLGVIVTVILLWRGYRPARMIAIGPSEVKPLAVPHNVGGENSIKAIAEWSKAGRSRPRLAQEPNDSVTIDNWAEGLDGREDLVTLFFCLQGGSDIKGAYLWLVPPEATAPAEKFKLRLSSILDRLAQLPDSKKKLLVLDATQVEVSFPLGQLHNDFVRELKKLDDRIESIPNLVVICASDDDQKSWYSEEWQQTIFTHYFVEGAKGAANASRVSIEKLFRFVADRVPAWVRSNRGEDQAPILLPTKSGMERAKSTELATVLTGYKPVAAASAPGSSFDIPDDLARAWDRRDHFEKTIPQPETIAPFQNRRYLDTLLRIESMLRAGMPTANVQDRLDQLSKTEVELTRNPWPELRSTSNALPMPAALGLPSKPPLEPGRFQSLWADPANVWPELKATVESQGDSAVMRLQFDICSQLLDFLIADNRPENLPQANALLKKVFGSTPAPTEAHILMIFQRDLDAKAMPDWPTLKLALQMHRLAEEIALVGGAGPGEYPASELVFPWIRESVKKADIERLRGEDLLFSSVPNDWQKANGLLSSANRQYLAIRKQAEQIRRALAARNQAMAELPYFARWVAGLSDEFEGDSEKPRKLLELVERTAQGMHQLASILEAADLSRLQEHNATANDVSAGLDGIRNDFFGFLPRLNDKVLIAKWRHIDNALQVPFIKSKRRMELLANLRSISNSLNQSWEDVKTPAAPANSSDKALERAQRQGRIALALLGSAWVNDAEMRDASAGAAKLKFEDLRKRVISPNTKWWESLDEAGEQIGWHWRALAGRVDALTEKASHDEIAPAMKELARADYLARLADSATDLGKERDPVVDYRRYCLHRFLLDQARRSIDANWASAELAAERSGKPSYAEETAGRFVKDAEQLIMIGASQDDRDRLLADVKPLSDIVSKLAKFDVRAAMRSREVTSQPNLRIDFRIQSPPGQPAGYPVLRYRSAGPCRVAADLTNRRVPLIDFVELAKTSVEQQPFVSFDSAQATTPGFVTAELWYRGHHLAATTDVTLYSQPSSVLAYNPPRGDAAFSLCAGDEMRKGVVAILLDWTRSMVVPGPNKYEPALNALEAVLAGLPPETNIVLTQFGDPDKYTKTKAVYSEPIMGTYCGDANFAKRKQLIQELRENEPDAGETPLARSILEMANFLAKKRIQGVNTIVALTDGEDNVTPNPGKWLCNELDIHPVVVNIVFFQAAKEEANAMAQFKPILSRRPAGGLYTAKNQGELITNLRDALIPRVVVLDNAGVPVANLETGGRNGIRVLSKDAGLKRFVFLKAGSYELSVSRSNETNLLLTPGDRGLFELYFKGQRVAIRPSPYIPNIIPDDDYKLCGESKDAYRVRAAVADAHLVANESGNREYDLEMMVLMERDFAQDPLKVIRPEYVWIEVRADTDDPGAPARLARVENINYLPCPAWRVTVRNWPRLPGKATALQGSPAPVVSLHWGSAFPSNNRLLARAAGQRLDQAFKGAIALDRPNRNTVRIESVRFENKSLVVDLAYEPGTPVVFVRPLGLIETPRLNMEEEHRFFDKIGKYTAKFGPVDENSEGRAFTLEFYSMSELQESAAKITISPKLALDGNSPLRQKTPIPIDDSKQ